MRLTACPQSADHGHSLLYLPHVTQATNRAASLTRPDQTVPSQGHQAEAGPQMAFGQGAPSFRLLATTSSLAPEIVKDPRQTAGCYVLIGLRGGALSLDRSRVASSSSLTSPMTALHAWSIESRQCLIVGTSFPPTCHRRCYRLDMVAVSRLQKYDHMCEPHSSRP
jgi:hypothetical protein